MIRRQMQADDMSSDVLDLRPKCVATTGDAFNKPINRNSDLDDGRSNLFRHARFTDDGTTIVTHNEDHCLRTFVLPEDLLTEREEPCQLGSHCQFQSASNLQSFSIYPRFNLRDPSTTLVLSASADVPITLRNALDYGTVHGNYNFIHAATERHRSARSLAFTQAGTHFIAGGDNVIAAFDASRTGEGPISEYSLKPSRRSVRTGALELSRRGFVSAMDTSNDGILAIGTTQREVALFENRGLGDCTASFSINSLEGNGVTGLRWSPDGRYLLVAERSSDTIQVFDIRKARQEVARLTERNAKTLQVLDFDVVPTMEGFEAWAGGTDGSVQLWSNPGSQEEFHRPQKKFEMHGAPVSSAVWHNSGVILATCSGARASLDTEDTNSNGNSDGGFGESDVATQQPDNTLKIWSFLPTT